MKKIILLLILLIFSQNITNTQALTSVDQVKQLEQNVKQTENQKNTLSDMVKYFDDIQTLNVLEASKTAVQITALQNMPDPAKKSAFENLSWNLFLTYPIDSLSFLVWDWMSPNVEDIKVANNLKKINEIKKTQLTSLSIKQKQQQAQFSQIQQDKQQLLQLTNNDEVRYEQLLVTAQAELLAEQSIVSGKVPEKQIGKVVAGEKIASIISGASTCSTGSHLHFEVRLGGIVQSPYQFLSVQQVRFSSPPLNPYSFSGTWSWPLSPPVLITQEYGFSWFAKPGGYSISGAYNGQPHTGIDMVSETGNRDVMAVADGTLFKGSVKCGDGLLQYARVEHSSTLSSYYLHVN